MRIAILSSWYPSDANPLYGIFIQTQARGLAEQNDVHVLLLERAIFNKTQVSIEGNLSVYRKKCLYLPNKNESLLKIWAHQYYLLFKKNHRAKKYDIIHCHDHYGAYAGWYISQKMGIPYIVTMHNSSIQSMQLVDWKKSYLPKVLDHASEVIAVGHKLSTVLKNNFTSKKVLIIPNVIDTNLFKPNEAHKSTSPFRFLFIGDLNENKGVMKLLSAFHSCQQKDTAIYIIGRGHLLSEVENFIDKNGLANRVTVSDQVPNEELPDIYNNCHAYISLSLEETFGITILEAMSCGLPVIYTKSGGPEHIVADHGCFETSKNDIAQICATMDSLVEHYNQINLNKLRQHVIDTYSSSTIINQLMEIYKSHVDDA